MISKTLGRLERVELNDIWINEAGDFTPWLAQEENIRILSEAIGIDLEVEAREKEVGPFRADILCKDTATGNWVLIENQLAKTDHTHLGQLMTYAAGLHAVTIVWIAKKFTDEHRAALDWLNEITEGQFNFFGLEIELWRIGNSAVAPKFNIISQPNDWSQTIAVVAKGIDKGELTETQALQLEFWTAFHEYALKKGGTIKPTKPLPQHWMNIAIGRSGFRLAAVASMWDSDKESYDGNELRTELVIDGILSKEYFDKLETMRGEIERELGSPLNWRKPDKARMCRIYLRRSIDLTDRSQWPDGQAWLLANLSAMRKVFGDRVRSISIEEPREVPVV